MKEISYYTLRYIFEDKGTFEQRKRAIVEQISMDRSDPNFEEIEIHGVSSTDYLKEFFAMFPQLKKIEIDSNRYPKEFIDFGVFPATNVDGKTVNTTLEEIKMDFNTKFKESPQRFENLKNLTIKTSALTGFPETPKLVKLSVQNSSLSTVVPLKQNFSALQHLDLRDNLLTEFRTKARFPVLKILNLGNNKIESFANAPEFPNVHILNLESNRFTDLASLSKFPQLRSLHLYKQNILPKTVSHYYIGEKDTALKSLEAFPKLDFLEEIELYNNGITALPSLDLPNLQKINLQKNFIQEIDGFTSESLKKMSISENNLQKIANVHTPSLVELDLEKNEIPKFDHLYAPNLQDLNINRNNFASLESLGDLPLLTKLDISSNKITTFKSLPKTHPDIVIKVYNNPIENFYGLSHPQFLKLIKTEGMGYNRSQTKFNLHPYATKLYYQCEDELKNSIDDIHFDVEHDTPHLCHDEYDWLSRSPETEIEKFVTATTIAEKRRSFNYLVAEIRPKNAELFEESMKKLQKMHDPTEADLVNAMVSVLQTRIADPSFAPMN